MDMDVTELGQYKTKSNIFLSFFTYDPANQGQTCPKNYKHVHVGIKLPFVIFMVTKVKFLLPWGEKKPYFGWRPQGKTFKQKYSSLLSITNI